MEKEKPKNNSIIIYIIKFICLISAFYTIAINFKNKENVFNAKSAITTRDLLSMVNLTNYNMVRFVDYEFLDFNSITIFKMFRKKYFNISNFKFDYNKEDNLSTIEYDFELYDENKDLFNLNNTSKNLTFACLFKKNKEKKKLSQLIDNKYIKCIETLDISKPTTLGVQIGFKKAYLKVLFKPDDILNLNLNKQDNGSNKINKIYINIDNII